MLLLSLRNNDLSPINKKIFAPEVNLVNYTNSKIHGSGHPNRFPRQCQCNKLKIEIN